MAILTTSLSEIRSFKPCAEGWRNILKARNPQCPEDYDKPFPLVECLESNSISDICWLLGKRRDEISICVKFARMCADSVAHLRSSGANRALAAYAAAANAAADAAYDAAAYAAYDAAVYAAKAYDAAVYAADAAAYAYDAAYAAEQKEENKQFLIQCIDEFNL